MSKIKKLILKVSKLLVAMIKHNTVCLNTFYENVGTLNAYAQAFINDIIYAWVNGGLYISSRQALNIGANIIPKGQPFKFDPDKFLAYIGFGYYWGNRVATKFVADKIGKKNNHFVYSLRELKAIEVQKIKNEDNSGPINKIFICRNIQYVVDAKKKCNYSSKHFDMILNCMFRILNVKPNVSLSSIDAIEVEINTEEDYRRYINLFLDVFSHDSFVAQFTDKETKEILKGFVRFKKL